MQVVGITGKCEVTKPLEADDSKFDPNEYQEETPGEEPENDINN